MSKERRDLSTMLGGVAPAGQPSPPPALVPQHRPRPVPQVDEHGTLPWQSFEPKTARLRPDQLQWLTRTRKTLTSSRRNPYVGRVTDNTLIRIAIDLLQEREADLEGITEEALRASLGLPPLPDSQ